MTQSNRAVAIALLALASAAEAFGATLREVVKRELIESEAARPAPPTEEAIPAAEPPSAAPCAAPEFTETVESPQVVAAGWAGGSPGTWAPVPVPVSATTPAPGAGAPVLEYNDTLSNEMWLIDEVGNVTRNGAVVYTALPGEGALTLFRNGLRTWFRTQSGRWFRFDGDKPIPQSTQPKV